MATTNYILWNPDLIAVHLGTGGLRWYSLCWLVGLAGAYLVVRWLYNHQGIAKEKFEPLFVYCFLGVLIGARLGHCLFYEPAYFLSSGQHFVEMILPIRFLPEGGVRFTGYEGLASHGGTIGLFVALLLYCHRKKMKMWVVLDNIAIATPLCAAFIRLGNLMNSEIVGKATNVGWAFVFERVDQLPRHPSQLYEALAYFAFFALELAVYLHYAKATRSAKPITTATATGATPRFAVGTGRYFGLCLTLIFTFRFLIEWTKVEQVAFEQSMLLNMGQLLSIPFIIIGIYYLLRKI